MPQAAGLKSIRLLKQASAIIGREEAQPTTDPTANHGHRSAVAIAVLGELEVRVDGRRMNLGGPTPRRLLLHLVLRRNQVVTLDELIEDLWPEPPVHPEKALHVLVSRVRASLGAARDRLSSRAGGYRLELSDGELDLARAASMEEKASTLLSASRFDDAATIAGQALDLWAGSLPIELYNLDALMGEATRIEELRVQLHHLLIEADINRGNANRAVGLLGVLIREHSLRERFWAQLMRALYATGRASEELAREAGNQHGELSTQFHLADLAIRRGSLEGARARASACLVRASETGDAVLNVEAIELLAQVDAAEGRYRESALLLGAAQGERNRQGWAIRPHARLSWHAALTNELRRELGDEVLIRLLADGAVPGIQRTVESQLALAR